jgi:hypothetical protein
MGAWLHVIRVLHGMPIVPGFREGKKKGIKNKRELHGHRFGQRGYSF